jgi:hypothetical protein
MQYKERLFYNKYKYRIRFILRKGIGLLRSSYKYTNEFDLASCLEERREYASQLDYNRPVWSSYIHNMWDLTAKEESTLLQLFYYREDFDPAGRYRVESPIMDFYTNNFDYVKKAEDTGLEFELCESLTDEENVIMIDKLPYDTYNLKCITRHNYVDRDIADALLTIEQSGDIRFPWTWQTRQMFISLHTVPLPEYIYALDDETITMVNLIAGDVISTVYSYKVI